MKRFDLGPRSISLPSSGINTMQHHINGRPPIAPKQVQKPSSNISNSLLQQPKLHEVLRPVAGIQSPPVPSSLGSLSMNRAVSPTLLAGSGVSSNATSAIEAMKKHADSMAAQEQSSTSRAKELVRDMFHHTQLAFEG